MLSGTDRGELPAADRALPDEARLLLLVAAAEPVDDPLLVWRAAERLGIGLSAAAADATEGLLAIGERVMFRHPLVRSAVYRSATLQERQAVHRALAEATDPQVDPDHRAWHLAQASTAPDERSPWSSSAPRPARRLAAGSAPPPRSWSGPRRCHPTHRAEPRAAGGGRAPSAMPVRSTPPRDCSARSTPRRSTSSAAPASRCCADRSPSTSSAPDEAARHLAGAARRLEPVAIGLARTDAPRGARRRDVGGRRDGPAGMRIIAEAALRAPRRPARPRRATPCSRVRPLVDGGHRAAAPSLHRARELVLAPHPATDDHGPGSGSPSPATPSRSPRSCGMPMPGTR